MVDDNGVSWERFLNPEILRTNLIIASIFLTAFEMLKDTIIERIRDFYTTGFNEDGFVVGDDYKRKVLTLNKSPLHASLAWLRNMDIIDEYDLKELSEIKDCRNEIAHEMTKFISEGPKIDPLPLFSKMTRLLDKIEKWWIVNVEIPTSPDPIAEEIDEDGIIPGSLMTLRLLIDIALGTEEESRFYYNELIKKKNSV